MKLLLLTLTVLVFLPQVIPVLSAKKCQQQGGSCRRSCGANEEIKPGCKYRFSQVCCVLRNKGQKEVIVHKVPMPPPIPEYFLNTAPMDYIITVPPKYTPVFNIYRDTENELSDQALETEVTLPPVP